MEGIVIEGVGEYRGELGSGGKLPHGTGVMKFNDGSSYEGQWKNGKRDGMGTFSYENGSVYSGMYSTGKKHGFGSQTYPDGSRYQGDWQRGSREGWGVFDDGTSQYLGQWKKDKKDGIGITKALTKPSWNIEIWSNDDLVCSRTILRGDTLNSQPVWRDALQGNLESLKESVAIRKIDLGDILKICQSSGDATTILNECANEKIEHTLPTNNEIELELPNGVYKGLVDENTMQPHGHGGMLYSDGTQYVGSWVSNARHGFGTLTNTDGSCYQGMFERGKKNGFGTLTTENGEVYEGSWKNDMMYGWGTFKTKDGTRHEGQWLNDMKDGCMIVTSTRSPFWQLQYWNNDQLLISGSFRQNDLRLSNEEIWKEDIKQMGSDKSISSVLRDKIVTDSRYIYSLLNSIDSSLPPEQLSEQEAPVQRSERKETMISPIQFVKENKPIEPGIFVKLSAQDAFGKSAVATIPAEEKASPSTTLLKFPFGAYQGEVSYQGKLEGKGTMKFYDGSRYIGEWKDDQRHGEGTFHYVDGTKYIGGYKCNKKSGYGTQNFANGDIYQGDWFNGAKDGWGMHRLNNGNKYEGQFKDDMKNGVGIGSNISASHRSLEVWNRGILRSYQEYQAEEFPRITIPALRRAFEKGEVKELKLSIENNLFDISTQVTPIQKKPVYDKKGIALRKGYLLIQKGDQLQKRWVEIQNNGFLAYYSKKRSGNSDPSKFFNLEHFVVKIIIERGKFIFHLVNEMEKQCLIFQASSPVERDSWVALFQKVATNYSDTPENTEKQRD